jgi:protein-disulfide isomerase
MQNSNTKQIVGAIVLAGAMIAGAILIRGGGGGTSIPSIAREIDLNTRSFNKCLADSRFKTRVQADIDDGAQAGVNGTPASFILKDGRAVSFIAVDGEVHDMIPGAQPYETVMENIKRISEGSVESKEAPIRAVSAEDHVIGDLNTAELVIVEYSDLECPFCQRFHDTMHQVVKDTEGRVAWVYRHYPIPQLHPKAFQAAEASECAWEQEGNEGFWKYADKVFEMGLQTNTF